MIVDVCLPLRRKLRKASSNPQRPRSDLVPRPNIGRVVELTLQRRSPSNRFGVHGDLGLWLLTLRWTYGVLLANVISRILTHFGYLKRDIYMEVRCASIEEVRQHIDRIDRDVVALLAKRGDLVTQAAGFKKTTDDVRAPARVEQVISKVRGIATDFGASPDVVERVYRAMISAFIEEELKTHSTLKEKF
ncbi:hypothetical protein ALP26_200101 [Pseudomonas savastanoi pv. glycinea]|nr:hypothetical protein ALP26_200101 [Pseudomonas savastanoi pv. glycinea]